MSNWFSRVLLLLAVGLAGWGAYLALNPVPDRSDLFVADSERDLGEVPLGSTELSFGVCNATGRPGQIIGLVQG